jgi:succinoglycan biosynthesis transport protein ExoP
MSDSQDNLNLSGLEYYTLRDYGAMFLRRKWFIIITTFAIAVLTAVVAYFLPNSYRATTVILVDPQKVPEYYVNPTVTSNAGDRLGTLRTQILSATRLGQIVEEMGLYKELKKKESQDEIVENMKNQITVGVAASAHAEKGMEAFTVSYVNSNPAVAAQVTNRLASLFIEDNIKSRELTVMGTADFLQKEMEDSQRDLKLKEDKITELKTKYVDVLPESEPMHVQALSSLQLSLQNERDAVNQEEQQKVYFQSVLGEGPSVVNLDTQDNPQVTGMETEKSQLEGEVDQLRQRYGVGYPDIVKKTIQIRDLTDRIEKTKKDEAARKAQLKPLPEKSRNPVVQSQIAKLDDEIQEHKRRELQIEQQIQHHQAMLAQIPVFQQQVSSVMRDYEAAQDHYKHLVDRNFSANMAADLEIRQKGERFEVLDPAQVPYKPSSPDRPIINLLGLAAGLVIGLVGAFGLEILDPSVKTEREVVGELNAPIFGEVPWLPTQGGNRRQRMRTIFAWLGSTALAAVYSVLLVMTWR